VGVAVRQGATDGGNVAHANIGERQKRAADDRRMPSDIGRPLERRQRRHRADGQDVRGHRDGRVPFLDPSKTHELCWTKYAGFHHQHQRGAAGNRTDRFIGWIEKPGRFDERCRFGELEWYHRVGAKAARPLRHRDVLAPSNGRELHDLSIAGTSAAALCVPLPAGPAAGATACPKADVAAAAANVTNKR